MSSSGDPPRDSIKTQTGAAMSRASDQRRRRQEALANQKSKRRDMTRFARGLAGVPIDVECDSDEDENQNQNRQAPQAMDAEVVHRSPSRVNDKEQYRNQLMMPEWLVEPPDDLGSSWYVFARPAGKRCMVISSRGVTTSRYKNGSVMGKFPSHLPCGSRGHKSNSASQFCILDCIYNEALKTYFVLDMMCWAGYLMYDCTSDFRQYWVHTKLAETTASQVSASNTHRFIPLPCYECNPANLQYLYTEPMEYTKDGLLFLHKGTNYEAGNTPLMLAWSDASCSERFYDYGSQEMQERLEKQPGQAEKWQCDTHTAAVTIQEITQAVLDTPASMEASQSDAMVDAAAELLDSSNMVM